MSTSMPDKEAALRIALAARTLPGVDVSQLLGILHERLGSPLDSSTLERITVTDLKTGLGSADGEEDGEDISIGLPAIKEAVRILWGELNLDSIPSPEKGNPLPDSIRVGVASNNGEKLDGHFGSCLRYLIYEVTPAESRLVDVRSALEADASDDRNAFRANLCNDCQVLFVVSVGGPAAAKIIKAGIYPMKRLEGGEARDVIGELQQAMGTNPPPWLAKAMGLKPRFHHRSANP